jgi:predicted PurR-regulated permease PerM
LLIKEVASLSYLLETGRIEALWDVLERPIVRKGLEEIASLVNMSEDELIRAIMNYVAGLGRRSIAGIAKGIQGIMIAALGFILMALTFFFMLRDAPALLRKVRDYLPFSDEQKDALLKRVSDIVFSTIYGGVVVALAQGTAGGAAFALLGISTPVVWGLVIAVVSFLPVVGPGIIWIPAATYFFMNGQLIKGLLLIAAGIGIAAIDTFLRPLIVGNRTKMPFLIIFFSVIGGIQFFGFIGFILGPLVLALFIAVLDVLGSMNGASSERVEGS